MMKREESEIMCKKERVRKIGRREQTKKDGNYERHMHTNKHTHTDIETRIKRKDSQIKYGRTMWDNEQERVFEKEEREHK